MQHYLMINRNFNNLGYVENSTGGGRPIASSFKTDGANNQLILVTACKKVPEKSSCKFSDSLLHHTENQEKSS